MSEKNSISDELTKLAALAATGALTKDEFEKAKAKILGSEAHMDTIPENKKTSETINDSDGKISEDGRESVGIENGELKIITSICVVILVALILYVINSFSSPPVPPLPSSNGNPRNQGMAAEPEKISASSLFRQYHANEVAADVKFKDRRFNVSGTVDSINKDVLDKPFVMLGWGEEYTFNGVQMVFNKNYEGELAKLHKGETINVTGICKGMILGNVLLEVE